MKPLGGHTGDGDGVILAFAFANVLVGAAPATGMQIRAASSRAITLLITIPFELTDAKENADY